MTDVRFTPQMLIHHRIQPTGLGIEELGVAPLVVLSWRQKLINLFADKIGAEHPQH
mgnify:FL=1